MAHTISDRMRDARDTEFNREQISREVNQRIDDTDFAGQVVEVWNSRLAAGHELFFNPSIGAAIRARKPILRFYCPACTIRGAVDLREIDVHPNASITALIPRLSCRRCIPNPPFARLTSLGALAGERAEPDTEVARYTREMLEVKKQRKARDR